jgi:hypothetical protein
MDSRARPRALHQRALVQTKRSGANARVAGDGEEMQRFVPIEDVFKGRHFDRQIIVLCVSWYTSFKLLALVQAQADEEIG